MSFVSARALESEREARKERKRKAHQEILEEAKEKFMKERKRQEQRKERGDDKWMAPGINSRLKLKKHKKHKKEKRSPSPDQTQEATSDNEDDMWVVKGEEPQMEAMPLKRDEWMTVPMGPSAAASKRLAELEELSQKPPPNDEKDPDEPGRHPLELNPYWKNGGAGLPEEESKGTKSVKVGDGGRSWLLRSYKRALERVKEDNVSLEMIATRQWGSLEKLYSLLEDANIDPQNPDKPCHNKRRLYVQPVERNEGSLHYTSTSSRVQKPVRVEKHSKQHGGFIKPKYDDDDDDYTGRTVSGSLLFKDSVSQSWKKKTAERQQPTHYRSDTTGIKLSPTEASVSSDNLDRPVVSNTSIDTHETMAPLVTDSQLNSLAAKLVKAEMLGNKSKIEKLKKELEHLKELKQLQDNSDQTTETNAPPMIRAQEKEENVILLTKTDQFGNTRPYSKPSNTYSKNSKGHTHSNKGKRKKYFSDDDQYSLKSLMEQEKLSTAEDTYYEIARMASKFTPSSYGDETIDDALDSSTAMKFDHRKEAEKSRLRTLTENRKMTELLDNCRYCFENASFEKHLLIAMGINVYLSLPSVQSLTEGHCLLVPMEHKSNSLILDENVWSEINIFKKGLTRMFSDREMDVLFMETYSQHRKHQHMYIECIPLPKEVGQLAPMYYKKAIQECDTEWSDNKKLIDTSSKGLRGSLPVGLSYFSVEFGLDGGYGHIIEDQSKFPHYFGKEVCGGMLDVEPRLWLKPHKETFEIQKEKVMSFSEWWEPYDWTQKLAEERDLEKSK